MHIFIVFELKTGKMFFLEFLAKRPEWEEDSSRFNVCLWGRGRQGERINLPHGVARRLHPPHSSMNGQLFIAGKEENNLLFQHVGGGSLLYTARVILIPYLAVGELATCWVWYNNRVRDGAVAPSSLIPLFLPNTIEGTRDFDPTLPPFKSHYPLVSEQLDLRAASL